MRSWNSSLSMSVSNVGSPLSAPSSSLHGSLLNRHDKWNLSSTNNQHVGVDLKAAAIIMMDAFCCCSYIGKMLQGKKIVPIDGSKLPSCFVFIVRYHGCLGVQSQGRAIGFPLPLSPAGMWTIAGWLPTERLMGVSPSWDTVQSSAEKTSGIWMQIWVWVWRERSPRTMELIFH